MMMMMIKQYTIRIDIQSFWTLKRQNLCIMCYLLKNHLLFLEVILTDFLKGRRLYVPKYNF
jgi:hypothetical protein